MATGFDSLDTKKFILIKGARVHNLKNIDVAIPRNKLIVITGLSGSGKSSLAFDTLYAEGQRRYVESLSSYARQFMGRMDKPDVDWIKGIVPAIAIEQKVNTRNPRSTVGTTTEIYDYLKLLFARIGKTYSPVSGKIVKRHTVEDVVEFTNSLASGTRIMLLTPVILNTQRSLTDELNILLQKGFTRIMIGGEVKKIDDLLADKNQSLVVGLIESTSPKQKKKVKQLKNTSVRTAERSGAEQTTVETEALPANELLRIVIDRFTVDRENEETNSRMADSVQTAFFEGNGDCIVEATDSGGNKSLYHFSNRFEMDGMAFEEPSTPLFSFNNPYGACKLCEGLGSVIGIDEDLVVPDKSLSIYEGAVVCWKGEKMQEYKDQLIRNAYKFDFPIHRPYYDLSAEEKALLWNGNEYFEGINGFFEWVETQIYKIQYRVMLSRYRGKTVCPECKGTHLRKDASYVKVNGKSITDLVLLSMKDCLQFFNEITLDDHEQKIAKRLLIEIRNRLQYMNDVGLGYLTMNRLSNSLSGGESQRINLATSLGSSLVGSMYILDEPSIGLHPRDTQRLITVLTKLKELGNTVIVVEHDEEIMHAADELIDIGPLAGRLGGELIFQGTYSAILKEKNSLTAKYLSGKDTIPLPVKRRRWQNYVKVEGARENNLKNLNVKFPLGIMTVVTGVSGSGKTSLVKKVLYPALKKMHGGYGEQSGLVDKITGDYNKITAVEFVDQNPIGKSTRSNPVTYVKAYDEIRALYSDLPMSRARKYKPSHFSFNVEGGRCEVCQGEGEVTIEMQFMADIHLICENCHGKRFKQEILDVQYKGSSIADVLDMTIDEAIEFFRTPVKSTGIDHKIVEKLKPLQDVGLGYVHLGQSSSTLSGGEAQRIKLASFLSKGNMHEHTLFIFDEPTTGLHFHDIKKLLDAFDMLIEQNNSIALIEHHPDIIKCADWVIDLGPEGGEDGGHVLFEGLPEDLINCKESFTGQFLKPKIPKQFWM